MPSDASRIAALRAGDVDAVDFVPPGDMKRIADDPRLKIMSAESTRVIIFPINNVDDVAPLTTDASGQPVKDNPFRDLKVRQALNVAYDRDAIVSRVMEGVATTATQALTSTSDIYAPEVKIEADPQKAKQLLAEAGYPDGLGFTLGCSNDRYINDSEICQAAAQMWTRAGFKVTVEAMPFAVFISRVMNREFPVYLLGVGRPGKADVSIVTAVLAKRDLDRGRGNTNPVYSNQAIDDLVDQGLEAKTEEERNAAFRKAMEISVEDVAYVASHSQMYVVAMKAGLEATPSAFEITPLNSFKRSR